MRRKCVSGSACESHCAGSRHRLEREHEAAEEDVRQEEEERHLHRLLLRLARAVEKNEAEREVRGDEEEREPVEQRQRADDRHVEDDAARAEDERHLHVADGDVRHDLADDELAAAHRRDDELLERAALALARDGHRGEHDHRHREDHADEPGHDVDRRARGPGCTRCRLERDRLRAAGAPAAASSGEQSSLERAATSDAAVFVALATVCGSEPSTTSCTLRRAPAREVRRVARRDHERDARLAAAQRALDLVVAAARRRPGRRSPSPRGCARDRATRRSASWS